MIRFYIAAKATAPAMTTIKKIIFITIETEEMMIAAIDNPLPSPSNFFD